MYQLSYPPPSDWLLALAFLAGMMALLAIAERLHQLRPESTEALRKLVHISTGVAVLAAPLLFTSGIPLFMISAGFAFLNFLSTQRGKLQSIHGVSRVSLGTVYYPLSCAVLVALLWNRNLMIFSIAVALLAFADAIAGIVGKTAPDPALLPQPWDKKSWRGGAAMLFSSTLIVAAGLVLFRHRHLLSSEIGVTVAIAIGLLATAAETLSYRGSDNLSVPLLAALGLYIILQPALQHQFLLGETLALGVTMIAFWAKALDRSGAMAAFLIGTFVFGAGGWLFAIPLLFFFITGSVLSRLPSRAGKLAHDIMAKGSRRDAAQVLANGLLPALVAIGSLFFRKETAFLLYLGGVAAATADTWATEIGLAIGTKPRSIVNGKIVAPGTSGGITLAGIGGALVGSSLVAVVGWWSYAAFESTAMSWLPFIGVAIVGVMAQFLDSLLGATAQRRNRCAVCKKLTERAEHCGQSTSYESGRRWLNNDVVNLACVLSGILLMSMMFLFRN